MSTIAAHTSLLKSCALKAGFDLVGIAPAEPIPEATEAFLAWLGHNYEGDMSWLARDPARRTDPRIVMPGARSVICLVTNYYPGDHPPLPPQSGKVARYAWGRDYHVVLEEKLQRLVEAAKRELPDAKYKYYVDYGPLLERAYAARAGLGYIGKNSCLITMKYGSWVFLSVVLTDLPLSYDVPETRIRCGTCRRCMDACPTKAIVSERVVDARRCISYQTIEKRGAPIDASVASQLAPWVFGCDVCQEVCPHNVRAQLTNHPEFQASAGVGPYLQRSDLAAIQTTAEFENRFAGTALMRARLEGMQNNARVSMSREQ